MSSRRNFLTTIASVSVMGGLAGCSDAIENANLGRGDTLSSSDTFGFEEIGGTDSIYSVTITAPHYCELTYQGEVRKPEEGFEGVGKVDILVISEPVYRDISLSGSETTTGYQGLDVSFLENPPADRIESPSQFDVNGEFEASGQMPAGNYVLLVVNHGERDVEVDLDTQTYEYNRESESVSCDQNTSPIDVRYLSVTGRYPYALLYHIDVNDNGGDEYSLSLDLKSAREELSFSNTKEPDICGTNFVVFDNIDMDLNVGDELRADITVSKDGEESSVFS